MQVRILRYWLFGIGLTLSLISSGCGEGGGVIEDSGLPQAVQDAISAGLDEVEVPVMEEVAGVVKPTGMSTIFHIDYASPVDEAHLNQAETDCGDATSYKKLAFKWTSFPVTYAIDTKNVTGGTDPTDAKNAVSNAFATWDAEQHPNTQFFTEAPSGQTPKVTVSWQPIDGPGGTLAYASTSYYVVSKAAVSSRVVYDSIDIWRVFGQLQCTGQGLEYAFDIEDVGAHEIGHVVGLGHTPNKTSNRPLTMYPYILHVGETLKKTLGTGDRTGLDAIY